MVLRFTKEAARVLNETTSPQYAVKLRKVRRTLALIEQNPRHPGLNSHKYKSIRGVDGSDVGNPMSRTTRRGLGGSSGEYGPGRDTVTILTIGPHPD